MRRWTVEGADSETGEDRVLSIDAPTREDAERDAGEQAILISAIHESVAADPLDMLGQVANAASTRGTRLPPKALGPTAPYATPGAYRQVTIPAYTGLQIGGTVLMVFAALYYIAAIVLLLIAVFGFGSSASR